jgi:2,3-bisphosphoglycerate-dependent phosphoglycerate mutase
MIPRTLPSTATAVPAVSESIEPATSPALWLVRHGESTWNIAGICQGHNDEAELTERGLRQAAEAADGFRGREIRAIYASDLCRARQTAASFAAVLGLPVRTDARLRERSFGVLEGTPLATVDPALTGVADGLVFAPDIRPPGGESVRDFYLRAAAFADALATELRDADDALPGDVLAIAHGGTLRVLNAYLHGVPVDQMRWRPVSNATTLRIAEFGTQPRGGNR